MAGSKLVPLYEQVARRIEQQVESGQFSPGQKIYSIREMCEQFDVSDVTAKKALRVLTSRGIIRTVTGSGVFVEDRSEVERNKELQRQEVVAFLKIGLQPAPIFGFEIDLIQRELSDAGFMMAYFVARTDAEIHGALAQIKSAQARFLVLFPQHCDDFEQADYMTPIRRMDLPLLIVETRSQRDSYVTADTERGTRELTQYLLEIGHRRICLASAFPRKIVGFQAAVAGRSGVKTWILEETGRTDRDRQSMAQKVLELSPRPTAVISSNDHAAAILISQLQASGVRVPEDMSVVTFDDHPEMSKLSPVNLTILRHPYREVAQEVAAWVQRLSQGGSRRRMCREITGTLIVRDSSAPLVAGKS